MDPLVVSITAVTPQGHTLARFESGENPAKVMRLKQTVTYEGQRLLDLVLVEDLVGIYREMAQMENRVIIRSLFLVILLGFISWSIFRVFAVKPMEREIHLRKQAERELVRTKNGLEEAVKKRTADLERTNIQLKKEIKERKKAVQMAQISLNEKEMLLQEHSSPRQELSQIDFAGYVQSLVKNLHRSYVKDPEKVRLHFLLEKVPLVVDTAIPCGLILSELLINAFKHAFPGQREGDITISFEELIDNTFNLAIQDNGVGFPRDLDLNNTTSLGLNLVNVLVTQLHGNLRISNKNGTRYEINFPEYHEAGIGLY
jgi:C4-dicarboxylate-specific signal transduction histidine kinase